MVKKPIPDAWEDDWEAQADKVAAAEGKATPEEQAPMSKAERLAKHEESNRKLWESAESPQEFHFLATSNSSSSSSAAPAAGGFKPAMKVLSRKPAPQMIAKKDPVTGVARMSLQDDDDDAQEVKDQETPEERKARQQKELEEKQRRYDEARAKIFGETPSSSSPSRQSSSPGNVTPPYQGDGRQNQRGRGRGRGGGGGYRGDGHGRHDSQGKRSPAQPSNASGTRELYDPNYAPKPGFNLQKRADGGSQQPGRATTPRAEDQIIRTPRGPDGSGRGGFGFSRQPAKDG